MCRRILLLYHIENTSIEEVCAFVHRLIKVFIFLVLLNCFKFVWNVFNGKWEKSIFAFVGASLIILNIVWLNNTKNNPTVQNSNVTLAGIALLCSFNLASLIFIVVTGSSRGLGKLLGIIIQGSTFFIIYKLREKIIRHNSALDENAEIRENVLVLGSNVEQHEANVDLIVV